jgi:hypothetical protein
MIVQIERPGIFSASYDPNINETLGKESADAKKLATRRTCQAVCELQLASALMLASLV